MTQVEFQLYPRGSTADLLNLYHDARVRLERETETTNIVRSYAANYMRAGRLQRFATQVPYSPPIRDNDDDFDDLPPLEEVD